MHKPIFDKFVNCYSNQRFKFASLINMLQYHMGGEFVKNVLLNTMKLDYTNCKQRV